MRKTIVAGNWKMHGTLLLVEQMCTALTTNLLAADVVLFPPYPYLASMQQQLQNTPIAWGAQTMSQHTYGAYSGDVSAPMLTEFGCQYVLLGHSERRQYYNETDADVAQKIQVALDAGLQAIVCVGETATEREACQTNTIIEKQITSILTVGVEKLVNVVIAYEPIWAIGTGVTATPEQAQAVHAQIRQQIAAQNASIGAQIPLLYGGSVKPDNAKDLFQMPDIDGGLIGGASLQVDAFLTICKAIEK